MGERRSARTLALTCALLGVGLLLFKFTRVSIALFHWAEKQIDRNSPLHMLAFLAVTLPFNIGLPIPIVHQARGGLSTSFVAAQLSCGARLQVWSVAIGCFFGWWAFPMLVCMLAVGVPLPFLIGRRLARGDRVAVWLRSRAPGAMRARMDLCRSRCVCAACTLRVHARTRHAPRVTGAMAYMTPLRRTVAMRPVRASFLLMWAPLPTSTLPLVAGNLTLTLSTTLSL